MDIVLLMLYAAVLIVQIAALVFAIRRPAGRKWLFLYLGEAAAAAAAWALMRWYDSLPGYGMMPGLTYFAETFFSLCAAVVYSVMLGISLVAGVLVWCRSREPK